MRVKYKHVWGGILTACSPVARRDPISEVHMTFFATILSGDTILIGVAILFSVVLVAALRQRPKACPTCGHKCIQSRFGNWLCPRCRTFHR